MCSNSFSVISDYSLHLYITPGGTKILNDLGSGEKEDRESGILCQSIYMWEILNECASDNISLFLSHTPFFFYILEGCTFPSYLEVKFKKKTHVLVILHIHFFGCHADFLKIL